MGTTQTHLLCSCSPRGLVPVGCIQAVHTLLRSIETTSFRKFFFNWSWDVTMALNDFKSEGLPALGNLLRNGSLLGVPWACQGRFWNWSGTAPVGTTPVPISPWAARPGLPGGTRKLVLGEGWILKAQNSEIPTVWILL